MISSDANDLRFVVHSVDIALQDRRIWYKGRLGTMICTSKARMRGWSVKKMVLFPVSLFLSPSRSGVELIAVP
jgi:hypothetical protein